MEASVSVDWSEDTSRFGLFLWSADLNFLPRVAWRHIFEPLDPILGYYKSGNGELFENLNFVTRLTLEFLGF